MALRNSQYDAIMKQYQQKQFHSKHVLDEHYQEVYDKHPEIKELDDSISSISVQYARKILDGDEHALASFKSRLQSLSERRRELLMSYGYPDNYLEPLYDCPLCRDTGYIENRKCRCFNKAAVELLYTQSNVKEAITTENFDHFSFDFYSDNYIDKVTGQSSLAIMKKTVTICKEFIRTFDTEFRNIFFYGDTGIGKTFLSNCIAKELIDTSHSVIYVTVFQLFDTFAKKRFGRDSGEEDAYEYIFNCDLLIIDDLGTELTNSFVSSELFLCLNERILRKKSTIISTNLSLETLIDTYSERTFSRISSNYTMLKLVGDDIRIKKKLRGRPS